MDQNARPRRPATNGKTILVADDDIDTNEILCKLLRSSGYETVSAFNGGEALARVAEQKPDVMILDVMMPGMDGIEVLCSLRDQPSTSALPIILFSGIAEPEFQEIARRRGADAYWVKGRMDFSQLKEMIELQCKRKAGAPL